MSDSVPGFRDIKMKTIQSVENRCRENFSLNSLYESYKKKKNRKKRHPTYYGVIWNWKRLEIVQVSISRGLIE